MEEFKAILYEKIMKLQIPFSLYSEVVP